MLLLPLDSKPRWIPPRVFLFCNPPSRQSREQREVTRKLAVDVSEQGIMSRSPITLVKKEVESSRLWVDFRQVNEHFSVPKYLLPSIDDELQ